MLVRLNALTIETEDIFAMYEDRDMVKPEYIVYTHDKRFVVSEEEFRVLESFLKVKVLLETRAARQ